MVILFIDFRAAFDSVCWPALWKVLESEHAPKIIRLLQETYTNYSSFVRIREGASNVFTIRSGVRQGCVLSLLLFNSVVDAIMREVFSGQQAVQIGEDQFVTDLMFADDSAVFADSDAEANKILQEIAAIALSYGLTMNAEKTKTLTTNGSPCTLCLNNSQIEQVEEFKYLGSLVQQNKISCSTEIHSRIGKAAMTFGSLTWCLWRRHNVSLTTKMRVFRSIVMSILLYGAETWVLLKAGLQKL
ncbi:unnamed protein product [Heligmosomoides polygyrus]|uniref:Reverse transcriptase domain-containing protein n=1 Tax=Heligmosomoides polygyrus TaxID=6339 RepID=A0A183GFV4_HELPZ|nr:unnamed protein product [Heligmosomoides polygyrus]